MVIGLRIRLPGHRIQRIWCRTGRVSLVFHRATQSPASTKQPIQRVSSRKCRTDIHSIRPTHHRRRAKTSAKSGPHQRTSTYIPRPVAGIPMLHRTDEPICYQTCAMQYSCREPFGRSQRCSSVRGAIEFLDAHVGDRFPLHSPFAR